MFATMKVILALGIILTLSVHVISQNLYNPNYQVINSNIDSTLSLVQFKKKFALFNFKEDKVVVDFCKSRFIFLSGAEYFIEIGVKNNVSIHAKIDSNYWFVNEKNGEAFIHFPPPVMESHIPEIINVNGHFQDKNFNLISAYESNEPITWSQVGVKKISENIILINDFRNELNPFDYLDSENREYFNSGIYNLATNTWLVEPQYQQITQLNNYVFCMRKKFIQGPDYNQDIFMNQYDNSYDIFKIENGSLVLEYPALKDLNNTVVAKYLNVDQAEMSADKVHYVVTENNKKGLVRFQLFDEWSFVSPTFNYQVILPITADFISFSPYYKKIGAVYSDSLRPVYLFEYVDGISDENNWIDEARFIANGETSIEFCAASDYYYVNQKLRLDKKFVKSVDLNSNPIRIDDLETDEAFFTIFSVALSNDSFVVYNDYCPDIPSPYSLMSVWGEDSLDVNGNVVYGPTEPGFEQSGVYDINKQKWLVFSSVQNVNALGAGFLVRNVGRNTTTNLIDATYYSCIDFNGEEKFRNKSAQEIIDNPDYLKLLVQNYTTDSIFEAPGGMYKHVQLQVNSTYYFRTGTKFGIFSPQVFTDVISLQWQTDAKDFVHANHDVDFEYWIENDSIYLRTRHRTIAEPFGDLKIIYLQNLYDESDYDLSSNADSSYMNYNVMNNIDAPYAFSSLEIIGDYLIINDQQITDLSCYECFADYDGYYNQQFIFQTENSTVWKYTGKGWSKVAPYYASIEPIGNGTFIVSTGYYQKILLLYQGTTAHNFGADIDIDERYLLLDSNLVAKNFVDYYDFNLIQDLGFGYKICLDEGCFFMTYSFQILTDAVWDEFLPTENQGEYNAIRNAVYEIDEYGDFVYDELGNWKVLVPEASQIFKLP